MFSYKIRIPTISTQLRALQDVQENNSTHKKCLEKTYFYQFYETQRLPTPPHPENSPPQLNFLDPNIILSHQFDLQRFNLFCQPPSPTKMTPQKVNVSQLLLKLKKKLFTNFANCVSTPPPKRIREAVRTG